MPLAIRITKDRKSTYFYLEYYIKESDWDPKAQRVKRSHPNSVRMNNYLIKKLHEATDSTLELETAKTDISVRAVRNKIRPTGGSTFFAQAQLYLDRLQNGGKYNQYTADKPRVKHFKEFIGGDIAFQDITQTMLERFKVYLKGTYQLGERSIVNHLVMIRSVFSQAVKDNIVDAKYYPFGKGKIKIKFPDSKKMGLNREEVHALETVVLEQPYHHARNLWLFSFYMAGMRISDVLRLTWKNIRDGRLHYIMGKNDKGDSLKMPERAVRLLEQYHGDKDGLIFDDLKFVDLADDFKVQRQIAFTTSRYDKFLRKQVAPAAKIDKTLTMHIARHTFAQLAGDKIDIRTLQKLYRHTKLETTLGYQSNFITKQADDALDAVLEN